MRVAMPIKKGRSVPQDPIAPSFLTKLPAEIRNAIYEYAFVDEAGALILIADSTICEVEPTWVQAEENNGRGYKFQIEDLDEERLASSTFSAPDCSLPVALLGICRQIYYEAASMLYGKNAFLVSVALHRHNSHHRQVQTAAQWLLSIGSQTKLLRQVSIDIDSRYHNWCRVCEHYDCIWSIGQLVKFILTRPELEPRITFRKLGRLLDARVHKDQNLEASPPLEQAYEDKLNNILVSLTTHDALKLQRCAPFQRLIAEIKLSWHLHEAEVWFPSSRFVEKLGLCRVSMDGTSVS
jgi:hypothetical protein